MKTELGQYIRNEREKQELSIRAAAKRCGLSHAAISMIERGNRKSPENETLMKLSQGLNIPYPVLLSKAGYSDKITGESSAIFPLEKVDLAWILQLKELQFRGCSLNEQQREFLEIFLCTLVNRNLTSNG